MRTAPVASDSKFPFDGRPLSPKSVRNIEKNKPLFTFCESPTSFPRRTSTATVTATVHYPSRTCRDPTEIDTSFNVSPAAAATKGQHLSKENLSLLRQGFDNQNHLKEDYDAIQVVNKPNDRPKTPQTAKVGNKNRFINSIMCMSSLRDRYGSKSKINSAPVMVGSAATKDAASAKSDSSKISSSKIKSGDTTMFPFDREAIDYERIQRECFAVEDDNEEDLEYPFTFDGDKYAQYEPSLDSPDQYDLAFHESPARRMNKYSSSTNRLEKFEYEVSNTTIS